MSRHKKVKQVLHPESSESKVIAKRYCRTFIEAGPRLRTTPLREEAYDFKRISSLSSEHATMPKPSEYYSEDSMREREAKAREEAKRRASMTAPLYNKGPYQYIGGAPKEIIKSLGRKE